MIQIQLSLWKLKKAHEKAVTKKTALAERDALEKAADAGREVTQPEASTAPSSKPPRKAPPVQPPAALEKAVWREVVAVAKPEAEAKAAALKKADSSSTGVQRASSSPRQKPRC